MANNVNIVFQNPLVEKSMEHTPGQTLAIIGTSTAGPPMRPISPYNLDDAERVFGKDSELYLAFAQAYYAGSTDIYLIRVNGEQATYTFYEFTLNNSTVLVDESKPLLEIRPIDGGSIYNDSGDLSIEVTITSSSEGKFLTITAPSGVHNYSLRTYNTLSLLVERINRDNYNQMIEVEATTFAPSYSSNLLDVVSLILVDGSDDVITSEVLYDKLETCYSILEPLPASIILPLGAYFDDDEVDFVTQLARLCQKKDKTGNGAIGVLTTKAFDYTSDLDLEDSVNKLLVHANTIRLIDNNGLIDEEDNDIGKYLSVIASTAIFYLNSAEQVVGSCASTFAGLVGYLPPHISPTNKKMFMYGDLPYGLTKEQETALNNKGFITIRNNIRKGLVPSQARTLATIDEGYSLVSNVRVAQEISRLVSNIFEGSFGEGYNFIAISQKQQELQKELGILVEQEVISDFSTEIEVPLGSDPPLVKVDFVPLGEISSITATVSLKI